ncbi:Armadillo-type fold domain containing protein [Pseudohyphozyma bogoriensis]|nr:Armadillo-type fold domain containing protein [Pseudohyphozyma bogoriensis]
MLLGRTNGSENVEVRRQEAFAQLKQICVPILGTARSTPSPTATRQLIANLALLASTLESIPTSTFTPALANYVFFPLTPLLQPPAPNTEPKWSDAVFEAALKALRVLVEKWRATPDKGMEDKVLHELWIMAVLRLGGPLDAASPRAAGKEKARESGMMEESKLALVEVLKELMAPIEMKEEGSSGTCGDGEDDDDPLGERIDWSGDDPVDTSAPKQTTPPVIRIPSPPPIPILFHTLTTLLSLSSIPTSLQSLQLSSLASLRFLFEFYLVPTSTPTKGPSPLLATALPGSVSTLARIALSLPSTSSFTAPIAPAPDQARRQPSSAVAAALSLLTFVLEAALSDATTSEITPTVSETTASLSEIVAIFTATPPREEEAEGANPPPPPSSAPPSAGPTLPTASWLSHTLSNLLPLFTPLATTLTLHSSPIVLTSLVTLFSTLLSASPSTLPKPHKAALLEGLLSLTSSTWPDVQSSSRAALESAFTRDEYCQIVEDVVRKRLVALPRVIQRGEERSLSSTIDIVSGAFELLPVHSVGGLEGVERWSWALLKAVELERVKGADVEGRKDQAWIEAGIIVDGGEKEWPVLRLKAVQEESGRLGLEKLWEAFGRWGKRVGKEAAVVGAFSGIFVGGSGRPEAGWVLDGVLRGFEKSGGKGGKKVVRNVVKEVLALLEKLEQVEEEVASSTEKGDERESDTSLLLASGGEDAAVVHQRAVSLTPSLDTLSPVSTSRPSQASHRILLTCFALRVLSTAASVLADSFQPHLLSALYHILSHLSRSSHPLLSSHASLSLDRISYSTSYASPQNLILSNVDYVLNSVSQRLSIARLDPSSPLVLVEMIRVVGAPILPMVQDMVEDVFEALDDYHGYEVVTMGLWAVLDALVGVMASERRETEGEEVHQIEAKDPLDEEWDKFDEWYQARYKDPDEMDLEDLDELLPKKNPQKPFKSSLPQSGEGQAFASSGSPDDEDAETSHEPILTSAQKVASQVLSKATYFLSHPSPFLRARILGLVASAVSLFPPPLPNAPPPPGVRAAPQSAYLPAIHRAWPYILPRLSPTEDPSVVLAAVSLIEILASHAGDFMSRRILEDAWPLFRVLIARQDELEKTSAVKKSRYTESHRIAVTLLRTMEIVARAVPLKEGVLWEIAVECRRLLAEGEQAEVLRAAKGLYRALAGTNEHVVWLVLDGMARDAGELGWLRLDGQQLSPEIMLELF